MTTHARGTFDVTLTPIPAAELVGAWRPGHMAIDKQFRGDLVATSQGEMMMTGTEVQGSAGYVAIERVTGTLAGRRGTFLLQHNGLMAKGVGELVIRVIPDSGTGELKGLSGQMTIAQAEGKHSYAFEYQLPDAR